jgi:hypothetical protein
LHSGLLQSKESGFINRWMDKKMWYIQTVEYYSAMKKNEILSTGKWIELEDILLNEINQTQK